MISKEFCTDMETSVGVVMKNTGLLVTSSGFFFEVSNSKAISNDVLLKIFSLVEFSTSSRANIS